MPRLLAVLLSWLAGAIAAEGQELATNLPREEVVRRGNSIVALVDARQWSIRAAAFCIHPSGLFVTAAGPVMGRETIPLERVSLILRPGEADERACEARVVGIDKEAGIALLRVEDAGKLVTLPPADVGEIEELMDVCACYALPRDRPNPSAREIAPTIQACWGRVSALQWKGGALGRIQFEAAIDGEIRGGLLLDTHGRVLGAILGQARAHVGAGVNLAVPVSGLLAHLDDVAIDFSPPVVSPDRRNQPARFEADVCPAIRTDDPLQVELLLARPGGTTRRVRMRSDKGRYQVQASPAIGESPPLGVRLEPRFADGWVRGLTHDRRLEIGGRDVWLHGVRRLWLGKGPGAVLAGGRPMPGDVLGLESDTLAAGGHAISVDLRRAREILVEPQVPDPLVCTVTASRAGKELARVSAPLELEGTGTLETIEAGRFIRPRRAAAPVTYFTYVREPPGPLDEPVIHLLTKDQFKINANLFGFQLMSDRAEPLPIGVYGGFVRVVTGEREFQFQTRRGISLQTGFQPSLGRRHPELVPTVLVEGWSMWAPSSAVAVWECEIRDKKVERLALDFVTKITTKQVPSRVYGSGFHGVLRYNSTLE